MIRGNDEDLDDYECSWFENRLFWCLFCHLSEIESKLDKFQSEIKSRRLRWKEDSFSDLHFKENEIEIWMNREERKWLNKVFDEWIQSYERINDKKNYNKDEKV